MKKILSIFVTLITTVTLWAGNVITYTASEKLREDYMFRGVEGMYTGAFDVTISSHTFSNGTGRITFSGDLTTIGNNAFYKCSKLTSITLPNSVTNIGDHAFYTCSGLTSITIPNSVTSIADYAFRDCSALASVIFGNSLTSIGEYAFKNCTSLTSITIPNSVLSIEGEAFSHCTGLTSVIFGNSVSNIGLYAFSGCTNLSSVTMGNSITSIGESAFIGCTNLTSVHISNLAAWCGSTFDKADSNPLYHSPQFYLNGELVTNLIIPSSVTSIGKYAFENCTSLTSVSIPNSVTNIGFEAFYKCSGLTSVLIPNSVENIDRYAFGGCTSLTSVEINSQSIIGQNYPNHDTYVNDIKDFFGAQVQSFVIGNSVTSIGVGVFDGCEALTSVTIGNSVTSIGRLAFGGCSNLTSVIIPASVTSIKPAFSGCHSLSSITVASGNNTYDSRDNCNAIIETSSNTLIEGCKNTFIPNSVTSIGSEAFYNCSGLTSITIPNSVTSIADYAFRYCSGLTSITIPSSVSRFGANTFDGCTNITSIVWNPNNCSISVFESSSPFYDIREKINSFVFGDEVESIPAYLCSGMKNLTSIIIPSSVSNIGAQAFKGCSGLTTITCEATTPPTCGNSCFYSVKKDIPLYVPQGSVAAYQTANQWKDFTNIRSLPDDHSAIDTQSVPSQPTKILRNGRIIIRKNNTEYDILGR